MAVCVAKATGVVTARPKCKAGETVLNANTIQGPQGTPGLGINASNCYSRQKIVDSIVGSAAGSLLCDNTNTDVMVNDGVQSNTIYARLSSKEIYFDSTHALPVGLRYLLFDDELRAYSMTITIVCCKL